MRNKTQSCNNCARWDTRYTKDGFGLCREFLIITTKDDGMRCGAYITKAESKPSEQKEGGNP